ncbi:MAG: CPBP family intramembrane glutamic endopeptidase [Bacteroidota bacterium]
MNNFFSSKIVQFVLTLIIMFMVSMTLFTAIPHHAKLIIRIVLIALFFAAWKFFQNKNLIIVKDIAFAFLALNIAFLVVSFFPSDFWGFQMDSPKGIALGKLAESLIISLVIILLFFIEGYELKSIYLTKGRLVPGLIIGVFFFFVFGYLAINNPQHPIEYGFLKKNYIWILVFVFANGFMEELIFRGIFLKKLNNYMKPLWSIILLSFCFAAPHLTVSYTPDVLYFFGIVFVLGLICGYAMYYTESIIAPTLIHAGADLMIIIPVYVSYGVFN